ncbi:MAG: PH domain-containing protein [Janthinobacterium lividum]
MVFAPRRLRVVGVVVALALVALTIYGWFALPLDIRVLFTVSQLLTLLGFLGVLVLTVLGVAASSVRADADGLRVRNGLRVHHEPWSRVHQIVLRPGDAWAFALMRPEGDPGVGFTADMDTRKRYLVGVQSGDGAYAREAVDELRRRLVASRATGSRAT